jgi:phage-related protein
MGANPDELRRDIEHTRRQMTTDVDVLTEKVSPTRIVQRRAERTRGRLGRIKEQVMGTASDSISAAGHGLSSAASGIGGATSNAGDAASSAVSNVGDTASATAQTVRRQAEGNPLAAGLIAFGMGWLVSSLLPTTGQEQHGAAAVIGTVREKAEPAVREAASELKDNLREPVQQAVESVKSTASDAAGTVQEQAKSSAQEVAQDARQAGHTVREQTTS